jgi:ATP adenylyltransferase
VNYEQIWAPWRMDYILGEKTNAKPLPAAELIAGADEKCFLCQCVPKGDDRDRLVVYRGKQTIVVMNRYPYNNGHLLIAPHGHLGQFNEIDDATHTELMQTLGRMIAVCQKALKPQGFNVGLNLGQAAGAGLPGHLHWHIVPRWVGDTHFMPILAGVRVIPQSLEALWELLIERMRDEE